MATGELLHMKAIPWSLVWAQAKITVWCGEDRLVASSRDLFKKPLRFREMLNHLEAGDEVIPLVGQSHAVVETEVALISLPGMSDRGGINLDAHVVQPGVPKNLRSVAVAESKVENARTRREHVCSEHVGEPVVEANHLLAKPTGGLGRVTLSSESQPSYLTNGPNAFATR